MSQDEMRSRVRRRRRSAQGGSGSTFSSAEGEPRDINEEVEQRAVPTEASLSEADTNRSVDHVDAEQEFTPRARLREVERRGKASGYEREYRLGLVNRMLQRKIPISDIAEELDVGVHTIMRDRKELYRRLREAAQKLDINLLVGQGATLYDEVMGMALRSASLSKAPLNVRLAAMRTALAAQNDKTRFLDTVGVLDVLKFRTEEAQGQSDIELLTEITQALLTNEEGTEESESFAKVEQALEEQDIHLF